MPTGASPDLSDGHRAIARPAPLPCLSVMVVVALSPSCLRAALRVEEKGDLVTVANQHFQAAISKAQGGAIAELKSAEGRTHCAGHGLYTDRGIYGDGVYVGTAQAAATTQVRNAHGTITVHSQGTLVDRQGQMPREPGTLSYYLEYAFTEEPKILVQWGVKPDFSHEPVGGFLSYLFQVADCIGIFANTDEGVLLQDVASHSTRTYASAIQPLSRRDPWLGLMKSDGSVIACTDMQSTVPFANVFLHETGQGGAAVFFAWMDGSRAPALAAGEELRGSLLLRVGRSFEAFRRARRG